MLNALTGFMAHQQSAVAADSIADMETVAGSTTGTSLTLTFSGLTDASQCVPLLSCRISAVALGLEYCDEVCWAGNVFDDAGTVK